MIEKLEWDSRFFNLRIGKLSISSQKEVNDILTRQEELRSSFDLIYVYSSKIDTLPWDNAFLLDRKVDYVNKNLNLFPSDEHFIEYHYNHVSKGLLELALASGEYSRFKNDHSFQDDSYSRLYTCWIEKSVSHEIATKVFCYMLDNEPRGFVTIKINGEKGVIGLVATDSNYRGQGIGISMMRSVLNYAYFNGVKEVSVVTQEQNEAACHLYEKAGFTRKSCTNVWHWWLNYKNNSNNV